MEGRIFPLKKFITLCAACLLALSGCTGGETATPSPEVSEAVSPTPLTVETPTPTVTAVLPTESQPVETTPAETAPAATAIPLEWDGNPDSLTLDDFPTQLSSGADVADHVSALGEGEAGLYLVCQLPEQDTWLYGYYGPAKSQGLILRVGTLWQAFDIPFLTAQSLMPAMAYGDYDADGERELTIVSFLGSGTGASVWGLSVVDFSDGTWALLQFEPADYTAIVELSLTSSYDLERNIVTLQAGDATIEVDLTALGYPTPGETVEATPDYWVLFTTEGDAIQASFGISLRAEGVPAEGVHAAMLNANVVYTGSAFGLSDFSFSLPEF